MINGIDVSDWQRIVDWPAVAAAGCRFAVCKATEGARFADWTLARNWAGAKAAGLRHGAYHFARPDAGDPIAQADSYLDTVVAAGGWAPGDLPARDLEDGAGDLAAWALAWLARVEARCGCPPLFYSGRWSTGPHGLEGLAALGRYPLWLASYPGGIPSAMIAPPARLGPGVDLAVD
jgi:GH25 family lysozyme M1 (1,4-beta-N-acetylmuramidase)